MNMEGRNQPHFEPDLRVDPLNGKIKLKFVDENNKVAEIRGKVLSDDFVGKFKSFVYTKILRTYVKVNTLQAAPILIKIKGAANKLELSQDEILGAAQSNNFEQEVLKLRNLNAQLKIQNEGIKVENSMFARQINSYTRGSNQPIITSIYLEK